MMLNEDFRQPVIKTTLDQLVGGLILDRSKFSYDKELLAKALSVYDQELGESVDLENTYTVIGNVQVFDFPVDQRCSIGASQNGVHNACSLGIIAGKSQRVWVVNGGIFPYQLNMNVNSPQGFPSFNNRPGFGNAWNASAVNLSIPVFDSHASAFCKYVDLIIHNVLYKNASVTHGYKSQHTLSDHPPKPKEIGPDHWLSKGNVIFGITERSTVDDKGLDKAAAFMQSGTRNKALEVCYSLERTGRDMVTVIKGLSIQYSNLEDVAVIRRNMLNAIEKLLSATNKLTTSERVMSRMRWDVTNAINELKEVHGHHLVRIVELLYMANKDLRT